MSAKFTFTKPERSDNNYELLEPGWYSFEVINCYDTNLEGEPLTSRKGIAYFKVVCRESESESVLFHFLFLDPEQAGKVSAFLFAIGYELEDGQEITLNADDFVGHWFRGRVEKAPGKDGVERNRITRVEEYEKDIPGLEDDDARGAMPAHLVQNKETASEEEARQEPMYLEPREKEEDEEVDLEIKPEEDEIPF